jgi:hypothetical protein
MAPVAARADGRKSAAESTVKEPGGRCRQLRNGCKSGVDGGCECWNTAPASVLCTVRGAASMLDLTVETGVAPGSKLRRTFMLAPLRRRLLRRGQTA